MSNTVLRFLRSTKGIERLSISERALIKLPDETKEVLVGILLGDAHIAQRSSTGNALTAVAHKKYFYYVLSFFLPFCTKNYKPQPRIVVDNRTKKTYSAISFPCFNEFRAMLYESNVKIVPYNIYDLLLRKKFSFLING